ncbi:TolC family outer membrane protein [Parendozoicomonas haliclonae]|uniref:Outer membrane efflux protein BepC n=1 Tax=Parendozoicomonas haliclonae TaxID=1960125 RepID=A0A1X7AQA5_9GAMM|nr:TolC family outer membrane protein [Parendozoicomonas haliclonae]SMA50476.1 Outer membrane efflux protein BepC precursor [Parendozoicomonas haliclonae]
MKMQKNKGWLAVVPFLASTLAIATSNVQAATLTDVVNNAIATNPEVLIRNSAASAKTDEVRQARSGYLPEVNLTAGAGFENSRNATTIGNNDNPYSATKDQNRTRREAAITLQQMIFDGFATSSEVDRQKARKRAADFEVCSSAEDIGLQATEAYTNVMKEKALVANAQANVDEHERIVELIRQRGNSMGTEADVAQAESRLLLAHANLISAEASLRDSKTVFQRVVGNLPSQFMKPGAPSGLPGTADQAVAMAEQHHPIMKITKADVAEAQAQYEASKSAFLPTFTAELGADWGKDQNGGKGTTYNHTAMVRMSFNLYNGGADSARKSQTSKLINEAMEIRNRASRQITEEVRLSWVAVDSGAKRLVQLKSYESNAKKARTLYSEQFKAGARTLLDLLDSQNEYFSAGNSRVRADYDHLYSQYRLLHSEGLLLRQLEASLPMDNRCGLTVAQI